MPNQDRTGPNGQGPMTGRGLGHCGGGLANRRRWFCPRCGLTPDLAPVNLTEAEEKKILEAEKTEIEKRLKELK